MYNLGKCFSYLPVYVLELELSLNKLCKSKDNDELPSASATTESFNDLRDFLFIISIF